MTENRITELWNKAVADVGDCTYPQIITRFSEFVVLDEREACAKVCESEAQWWRDSDAEGSESLAYEDKALESAARAIRMRSNDQNQGPR